MPNFDFQFIFPYLFYYDFLFIHCRSDLNFDVFLIDFAISLAAMSLEYSLAKAREKHLLKRVLDLQIVIILRSRF